jgi:hypothetical protein
LFTALAFFGASVVEAQASVNEPLLPFTGLSAGASPSRQGLH